MPTRIRIALLVAIPVAVLLLPVAVFAIDRARSGGEVARNVTAAGVDLGGLGEEDAIEAMRAYEEQLRTQPATFTVNGTDFKLRPAEVGLDIDEEAIVAEAMLQRREGFFRELFGWVDSFSEVIEIRVRVSYEPQALDEVLRGWEEVAIANPAYEGGILILGIEAVPDYPRTGEGIERDQAQRLASASFSTLERLPVTVPTSILTPELTNDDIDAAVDEANLLIGGPVTLTSTDPDFELVLSRRELAAALRSEITTNSPVSLSVGFDPMAVARLLEPHRESLEMPPRDAAFRLSEGLVSVVPGRSATVLDTALVVEAMDAAARRPSGSGDLPLRDGVAASFTTAEANAMMPITRVSRFTTEFSPGQPRVTNIQNMAKKVDGVRVWPGEVFSLNGFVGERTEEKGYVPAPMILRGEVVDAVGGGVSQFATTFYNAVFHGCYEDVTHKPHSFYFTRYPEVNEATVSWPEPDLQFRNNSDAVIIINTGVTDSSVTVEFYGNTGRTCERRLGTRSAPIEPAVEYETDSNLAPDREIVVQEGTSGFANSVRRIITYESGATGEETWTWTYQAQPRIIRVHPCRVPGTSLECPVSVPDVTGLSLKKARNTLQDAGFSVVEGSPVEVTSAKNDGLVVEQSPVPGSFLEVGEAVTIRPGTFIGPPPTTAPPDTTTTTTTEPPE